MIKHYEQMIKTKNKKVMNIFGRQGQLLKKFKDNENLFKTTGQSKSTINFKIALYKFFKTFPVLKNLTLSSNYFKNNFELIKTVSKNNLNLFTV